MAEALYIPRFTAPPPVAPRVNFWTALDWDPYESRVSNGVHVVKDGKQAGVYLADGNDLIQLSRIPAVDPANLGNLVLRTLAAEGLVNGNRLADELRYGDARELWPGCCFNGNGTSRYISTAVNSPLNSAHAVLETWVYVTATANFRGIFEHNISFKGTQVYGIQNFSNIDVTLYNDGGTTTARTPTLSAGWTHLVVRINRTLTPSTCVDVWVNGVKQSLSYITSAGTLRTTFAQDTWYTGALGAGTAHFFNERIFSSRVIHPSSAWSDAACAQLYTERLDPKHYAGTQFWLPLNKPYSAAQEDVSGNGNDGTIQGYSFSAHYFGKDVPRQPLNDVGYSPSGTTNYLTAPNDFTAAAWTKRGTCVVTANQEYHPTAGTLTADKIEGVNLTGNDIFNANYQANGMAAGLRRRSVWIKRISTSGELRITDPLNGFGEFRVNLATVGAGWVLIDSAAATLPTGVTRQNQEVPYNANEGGLMFIALSGGPLSFYAAEAELKNGYLVGRNESNPTQDLLGNSPKYKGKCPARPRVIDSNCITFNGTSQHAAGAAGAWSTDGTEPLNVKFWIKVAAGQPYGIIVGAMSGLVGWDISLSGDALMLYMISSWSGNVLGSLLKTNVCDGAWHYIEVDYPGTKNVNDVVWKVDGIRAAASPEWNTLTGSTANLSALPNVGARDGGTRLTGSLNGLRVKIGSKEWVYDCAEGNGNILFNRSGGVTAGTGHLTITGYADSMWTTKQSVYNGNLDHGCRKGPNLLKDSRSLSTGFSGSQVSRTEVEDMTSGAKACRLAKTSSTNSASWQHEITSIATNGTPLTFSFKVRATTSSDKMDAGLYHTVNGFGNSSISWQKISGPGTISQQLSGSLVRVTGLSQTEWTHVRVTASLAAGGVSRLYLYPDTYESVVNGQAIDTTEWQLEWGSAASTYYLTDLVTGLTHIPVRDSGPLLSADGRGVTHPAGDWHNLCESKIDFTCGQPLAPLFQGVTPPTAYSPGTTATGLTKQVYSNKERAFTLSR